MFSIFSKTVLKNSFQELNRPLETANIFQFINFQSTHTEQNIPYKIKNSFQRTPKKCYIFKNSSQKRFSRAKQALRDCKHLPIYQIPKYTYRAKHPIQDQERFSKNTKKVFSIFSKTVLKNGFQEPNRPLETANIFQFINFQITLT